ncbi:helix-turn-helix domain-containing protein [Sphingobacterium bambusae]|uniref:Type II toxin-antitoxin system HigA family antitoxin n=1 Tax=Sphingobacterium bambusae TaxID=662858 RepID=A0ABW6BLE7_9SPHI|nr:XRE family transcriptional regulator [Sphingobacterium bambusae]WPL49856.1 XRE family transcriptional regulator [Sphingobacterium bambusae]
MWYLLYNEADYKKALQRFEELKNVERGTDEHKEKMLLVNLISEYETKTFPISDIDPIEMIKIRLEEFGYNQNELGNKSTISKVLNYKQPLSLKMIREFSEKLKIPAEFLIKDYQLKVGH